MRSYLQYNEKSKYARIQYGTRICVKALIAAYVKDKTEENLIKAFAEFGLQNNRFAKELKHIAIDEFRAEIDKLVTRDEFQASMQTLEARLESKIQRQSQS